jgi:hypothetical protein
MLELDSEDRLSAGPGDAADSVGATLGEEPSCDPVASGDALKVVRAGRNPRDCPSTALVRLIQERLEQHSHFRGRTCLLQIELVEGTIVVSGCLPSHYLKQLLQEAIRPMLGVVNIDNRVLVMRPDQ